MAGRKSPSPLGSKRLIGDPSPDISPSLGSVGFWRHWPGKWAVGSGPAIGSPAWLCGKRRVAASSSSPDLIRATRAGPIGRSAHRKHISPWTAAGGDPTAAFVDPPASPTHPPAAATGCARTAPGAETPRTTTPRSCARSPAPPRPLSAASPGASRTGPSPAPSPPARSAAAPPAAPPRTAPGTVASGSPASSPPRSGRRTDPAAVP